MKKQDNLTLREKSLCEKVASDPLLLKEVLRLVRASAPKDHRFDVNLAEGIVSEKLFNKILTGEETVEVKRDFKVSETGYIAIELAHNHGKKATGLSTTEADWWAIVMDGRYYNGEVVIFIKPDRLKRIVEAFGHNHRLSGVGGRSNFKLLNPFDITSPDWDIDDFAKAKRKKKCLPKT